MKKLLLVIAALLLWAGPSYAQKTKAQINSEITTLFPDNTGGLITPLGLRTVTADIVNSIMPAAPVLSGNLACFSGATGLLQDCGSGPTPTAITALTGDITAAGPGSVAATLATVNANTGSWGTATQAPQFTVDGKGRITAAINVTVTPAVGSITGLGTGVATALAVNVGTAGSPVINGGAGGTPSSLTLTSATGLPTTGLTGTLQAAQEPAHTGDVANSAGSLALTIAANAVTNAKMATMNAFTLKGNATGSGAVPTDISIPALTQKVSPAAGDFVMIADSAASNALKYALVSSLASAGSVSSIAGNTGAFTLANGIDNSTNQIQLTAARRTLPTSQPFSSGTGATYTTPANCLWIEVYISGAGGGGGGSGSTLGGNGGLGGTTTFNSITAVGGSGGVAAPGTTTPGALGGAGGTGGTGTVISRWSGQQGGNGGTGVSTVANGQPGVGGMGGLYSTGGSGGAIAGNGSGGAGGGGGGEGAYFIINSPSATYTYTVGAGGTVGTAGSGGSAGIVGQAGRIVVIEHYGS